MQSLNLEDRAKRCLENPLFDHDSRPRRIGGQGEYDFTTEYEKYFEEAKTTEMFRAGDVISLLLLTFLSFAASFCFMMRYDVRAV